MGHKRNASRVMMGNPEEKKLLGRSRQGGRKTITLCSHTTFHRICASAQAKCRIIRVIFLKITENTQ